MIPSDFCKVEPGVSDVGIFRIGYPDGEKWVGTSIKIWVTYDKSPDASLDRIFTNLSDSLPYMDELNSKGILVPQYAIDAIKKELWNIDHSEKDVW